jgi:hypothetical protein
MARNLTKNEILIKLLESESTRFGKEDFAAQSFPQKVFSSIWALESEVDNGGFSQYFLNSSSETAYFVVEALRSIGGEQTAHICERAIAIAFPYGLPSDAGQIASAAAEFSEELLATLHPLDQEFYRDPDNLTELLFAYVAKHPEEFGNLVELT